MPKGSAWRVMQFDTLRLRLVKLAARVVELKTQIKVHLLSSAPEQTIFGKDPGSGAFFRCGKSTEERPSGQGSCNDFRAHGMGL
jgi:hypothetical protein